jgi:citrate synthase
MGGAGEQLAQLLVLHLDPSSAIREAIPETSLQQLAMEIVTTARRTQQRIAGYGIPLHAADPRAPKLLDLARVEGVYGNYCRLATHIEAELESSAGRRVPMNLDGVGAALILDLGLPWRSARLFIITPRTVSMGAHYLEELSQETRWRHINQSQIDYQP